MNNNIIFPKICHNSLISSPFYKKFMESDDPVVFSEEQYHFTFTLTQKGKLFILKIIMNGLKKVMINLY